MHEDYRFGNLIVSGSPHIVGKTDTTRIMGQVLIALAPAFGFAVWSYGARAIFLTAVCVISCVVFEYLFEMVTKRANTVSDLSAAVTGVILAFNLPVTLPYWMAVIGAFVAIVITKQLFGGIGRNFANPAITARVVLFVAFSSEMTTWAVPGHIFFSVDAVTSATPLGILNEGGAAAGLPSNLDMFLGTVGGSMGEVSALALLIGGAFLLLRKIISPAIPVAFIGSVFVFALVAGQDPVFHICAGGVMLGALFMATDYSTSPITVKGKIIFGIGCGVITMMIRLFGAYPEGVSFAILIMNLIVPHIDKATRRPLYGTKRGAAKGVM
ncbi:MAG: RnfABCDGE type electron transport complex subunit D [Clostridiales Family XIII bacterium]|jgi:electron transport complex protein RnfD|nr:RnfABCDGE type electron transport complex subunit D [Clostridiales Family XIII bacterium]